MNVSPIPRYNSASKPLSYIVCFGLLLTTFPPKLSSCQAEVSLTNTTMLIPTHPFVSGTVDLSLPNLRKCQINNQRRTKVQLFYARLCCQRAPGFLLNVHLPPRIHSNLRHRASHFTPPSSTQKPANRFIKIQVCPMAVPMYVSSRVSDPSNISHS
ncbi:hypothetical protein BGZ60DRAFT_132617 [Tricladium varicosporioides]|nr:hypothetical protein BGZ60DRAFT_132617 [Hymenoscyphus varicosporioides]